MAVERIGESFLADEPKTLLLEQGFRFTHGQVIAPFSITYETFGELNADKSNAILVCHALSASAHAAGVYTRDEAERPGWWDGLIGYGKAIDLDQYFVICVNLPGSPFGTTAPKSIDPKSGKPYGSRYPWVTIEDMVESQKAVLKHLGIKHLRAIAGGSLGGMQVLMWCAMYPNATDAIIAMATGAQVPVHGVGWHILGRKIVEADQRFNGGDYYESGDDPLRGLQVARMLGHMTYLSHSALQRKFGRRRRAETRQFEIESYFEYQGKKFAQQFDANSYIRVQAAMDEMDLEEQFGSMQAAFARWRGRTLLVSFDTDWLFPVGELERVASAMRSIGVDVCHEQIMSANGHDTFLIDFHLFADKVRQFLEKGLCEPRSGEAP